MNYIKKLIVYTVVILLPFFLLGCQGWLAPNIGAL